MVGNKYNCKQITGSIGLLFVLMAALTAARCDNDKPFASQLITFILPVTLYPSDSVTHIGDTLWVTANISASLVEFNTNKKYRLENFDFGQTSIVIRELTNKTKNLGNQPSAAVNFNQIVEIGEITFPGETYVDFKFKYDENSQKYLLKIGLIPMKAGVFSINFLSPKQLLYNGLIDLGRDSNGVIIVPIYEDLVFPINNGVNNFDLFKRNCLDVSDGPPENYRTNYRYVTFTFRVK